MRIASAASAFPEHYYSQKVLLERLQDYWGPELKNPLLLARLHRNVTVDGRYLAIPAEQYVDIKTWGQANDIWIRVAQELGEKALCLALHNAGLEPSDLGCLLFTTVTGVASPSIDALLINRMKLPTNIRRTPIFGLGCVAGAAGIARASDYVRAYPKQAAALVSVELCSLTLQREDLSVANLISSGLFADGAAAVIVTGPEFEAPEPEIPGPTILATRSVAVLTIIAVTLLIYARRWLRLAGRSRVGARSEDKVRLALAARCEEGWRLCDSLPYRGAWRYRQRGDRADGDRVRDRDQDEVV